MKQYIQLSSHDITVIETLFDKKTLVKGELFLQEGKICRDLGFINKGLVCYYVTIDATEAIHNFAMENEFICNYDSFISKTVSQKSIIAWSIPNYFAYPSINCSNFIKPSLTEKDLADYTCRTFIQTQ